MFNDVNDSKTSSDLPAYYNNYIDKKRKDFFVLF